MLTDKFEPPLQQRMMQAIMAKSTLAATFKTGHSDYTVKPAETKQLAGHKSYVCGYSVVGKGVEGMVNVCSWVAAHLGKAMRESGADTVIVRGTSGLAVAFGLLARGYNGHRFVMLRKNNECSHGASREILNPAGEYEPHHTVKYLILDDFIASGNTIEGIIKDMPHAECVGIMLYADGGYYMQDMRRKAWRTPKCDKTLPVYGRTSY